MHLPVYVKEALLPKPVFDFAWATDDVLGTPDLGEQISIPSVEGRHVVLRPLSPNDYSMLQMLETEGELAGRWRFRGQTPSPEQWLGTLWNGVLAQFLVVSKRENVPVGLVLAYRASFQDGHAYIAALKFDPASRSPHMMLGMALFVDYVFGWWDFTKLAMEVPAFNMPQFAAGAGRYFEIEGRLRDHYACADRKWDLFVLAIHRDNWLQSSGRALKVARGTPPQRVKLRIGGHPVPGGS